MFSLVNPFMWKKLISDLLFSLLRLAHKSAWWTWGESGVCSCWLWTASSVFSFSTSPALKPTSLVFSPLSSHLLSLAVSRVKSFPITYRGIWCTWTARWGPFLFLTSSHLLSVSLSLSHRLISLATVLLLQHSSNSSVSSVLWPSVHPLQILVMHLLNADGVS